MEKEVGHRTQYAISELEVEVKHYLNSDNIIRRNYSTITDSTSIISCILRSIVSSDSKMLGEYCSLILFKG